MAMELEFDSQEVQLNLDCLQSQDNVDGYDGFIEDEIEYPLLLAGELICKFEHIYKPLILSQNPPCLVASFISVKDIKKR
jgi:hypothetical protein